MSATPTPPPTERDENLELVKQMGADWYDPIPPEQYTCFQDPEFTLTARGHRMLAELRAWTIRGRKGGRTAHVSKDGRALKLPQIGALLDWDAPTAVKVWKELEEHGLVRRDEKGWLWLCGRVARQQRPKPGENSPPLDDDQEWQKFCTDNFPDYLAKQFQQLSKNDRPCLHQDIEAWEAYEKQVAAQAMAAARDQVQRRKDAYLTRRYRVTVRRFERKTADEEKPKPVVQLSLLWDPELSVQNSEPSSVQNANGSLYTVENGSVQTTLNKELKPLKQSDSSSSSFSSRAAAPQNATTTDEKPLLIKLAKALRQNGATPDGEALRELIAECRKRAPDATVEEIAHFVLEKSPALPRGVRNAMAWFKTAVPKCFDPESLAAYRDSHAAAQPAAGPIAKLEDLATTCQLLESMPDSVNREAWREQLKRSLEDGDVTNELRERIERCLRQNTALGARGGQ